MLEQTLQRFAETTKSLAMASTKPRTTALFLGSLASALVFTGCSSTSSTKVNANAGYEDVAKVLTTPNSIESMPLVPPQEDVRIGDVFIMEQGTSLLRNPKWASLEIVDAVNRHYTARPMFSQTADEYFMESADEEGGQEVPQPKLNPAQPRTILIGPLASIEGRDQFWRLIPPQVLALTLPPERRPNVEVAMRASAAQSYSLPQSEVLAASLSDKKTVSQRILENLDLVTKSDSIRLFIVSEVIYARAISMGIRPRNHDRSAPRRWSDVFDGPMVGLENASALNQQLRAENLDDLPSGELRFLSVSDQLILFRNTLEMPVAIGVRGISIDIDPVTGEVLQLALKHSDMKTLMRDEPEAEASPLPSAPTTKRNPSKLQPATR